MARAVWRTLAGCQVIVLVLMTPLSVLVSLTDFQNKCTTGGCLSDGIVNSYQFRPVGKGGFYLHLLDHFRNSLHHLVPAQ